jgi:2,4-dienoyl-CoA reductase-like NADH-dependent reductase (Old Yellow Enzyme family)
MGAFMGEGAEAASLDGLVRRMEKEEFDLIAVGRALLGDPRWAAKVKAGDSADLKPFEAAALRELV